MSSPPDLKNALKNIFGFDHFRGQQEAIIKNLLLGQDTFVIMPTGAGKSICYQLPAMILEGTAVIVSPLIALMKNQVDSIENQVETCGVATFLNSSLNRSEIAKIRTQVSAGKIKMLYIAPESLAKEENIQFLKSIKISFYAIDEVHCISEWGHDFRPEYRKLKQTFDLIQKAPIIALTATATEKVQQDIQKNLNILDAAVFKDSFNRPNLYYDVRPKNDVVKSIVRYVKDRAGQSGVIYCLSRKTVEEISDTLNLNHVRAVPYHAGLDPNTRSKHQDLFIKEEVDVIVATIAFGMGIDKPNIRYVIHHDIPKSLEAYYQETGRAGRDGKVSECLTFYSYKDIEKLDAFLTGKPQIEQEIGKQLLVDMSYFAEASMCRRTYMLYYFGEHFDSKNCKAMCDNCKNPREQYQAKEAIIALLEAVEQSKQVYNTKDIINFLLGYVTSKIKSNQHQNLESFGHAKIINNTEPFWNSVIRQSLLLGVIKKEIEDFGLLHITDQGKAFLENPAEILFFKERDYSCYEEENWQSNAMDTVLYSILKNTCKDIARKKNLPPYIIFSDSLLEDMAIFYPVSLEELKQIPGISQGKASKYGQVFIDVIAQYVEENNIVRQQELLVRSMIKNNDSRLSIIRNIDKQMPFEDIQNGFQLNAQNFIEELENLVQSGAKLSIDYHLKRILDDSDVERIINYLRKHDKDCLSDAVKDLGKDYTEEEIRLVRIKFLSDFAH
jgi:ATP-dependent DNA helicase RecQ